MTPLLSAGLMSLLFAQALPSSEHGEHGEHGERGERTDRADRTQRSEREAGDADRAPTLPLPLPDDRSDSGPRRSRRAHPLDPATLRGLFAADPPIEALRTAATALVLAEPDRARALVGRARYAGVLPELRLMAERRFARTESVDLGSPTDATALAPVGIDSNNDVRYQARATWDLSKIIFNPDEIGAQFQALRTADARREVESLVIRLYFERRRLKAESAAADDQDMPSGLRRELRIAEVEAELDALTGGAFVRLARHPPIGGESWPPP